MSDYAWSVLENVVIYAAAGACFYFLPEWWKLIGFAYLAMTNTVRTVCK